MILREKHEERLYLYNEGLNDHEIASRLGLNQSTISCWRYKYNLPANAPVGRTPLTTQEERKRLDLYNQGLKDIEIAQELGLTSSSITYWRKAHNLPSNQIRCPVCENKFDRESSAQKYCCPECRHIADQASGRSPYEYTVRHNTIASLRKDYYRLLNSNPAKALEMKRIMEEEEGLEFTNLALDGIVEQEFSKPEVQKRHELIKKYGFDK